MTQVLFVPGIKGSELFVGDHKVWFPQTLEDLKTIDISNPLEAKSLLPLVNAFNLIKVDIYNSFLAAFPSSVLSVFPYDWRQSLFHHVDNLIEAIEVLAGNEGVTLVSHSMGGLLCKLAILKLDSLKKSNLVKKLITIGTPWLGSPDAYKALTFGEPGIFEGFSQFFPIYSAEHTRELSRLFPSVYQLLPHETYFNGIDGKFLEGDKGELDYLNIIMNVQQFFNAAFKQDENQPTIDVWKKYMEPLQKEMQKPLPSHIIHDCLIGYGMATLYKVPQKKLRNAFMFKGEAVFKNGDGVVPIRSAEPPHHANKFHIIGKHASLCSMKEVIDFVKWSLSGSGGPLPAGIERNNSVSSTLKGGKIAKIKCPVETTILDSEGLYVAGVFDPSVPGVSELANNQLIEYYTIGESKYMFISDAVTSDLTFEINAYETGVADVSIQLMGEDDVTEIAFDPMPVSKETSAKLKLTLVKDVKESELLVGNKKQEQKVRKVSTQDKSTILEPVPKISVKFTPATELVKKSNRRSIYSGPVQMKIKTDNDKIVDQIFYSINDDNPLRYEGNGAYLDLPSGTNKIRIIAKDIYKRAIAPVEQEITIDDQAPFSKVNIKLDPEGIFVHFDPQTYGSRVSTFYRILTDNETDWTEVTKKELLIPEIDRLRTEKGLVRTLEYFSRNEFGFEEVPKQITLGLGNIPELMWGEETEKLTPRMIISRILGKDNYNESSLKVLLISKGYHESNLDQFIPDDVKGVRFVLEEVTIEVLYSEKYSLYFSGPPTELLTVGESYNFKFELLTERTKERVINSSPKAVLRPIGAKNLPAKKVDLVEKGGVFYGKFDVDSTFLQYKHKLVITDNKNSNPSLREITLMRREFE